MSRVPRRAVAPPIEFAADPIVWAAWLYYEEQLTQEDVAERMGVSRATVNNLLAEARRREIVSIAVSPHHLQSVRAARLLAERFDLRGCVVVPGGDAASAFDRVGRAGARLLAQTLRPDDILGVAWGRTVLSLSYALPPLALPSVTVVQIAGSAVSTGEFSPEFCTSNISSRIGARCVNLFAPGIVSRPEVKDILMAEPALMAQFDLLRSCNKILFGVAGLDPASMPSRSGYLSPDTSRSYAALGAVGVLAGRCTGRDGAPVHGELDGRMIGLTLDEIHRIPERICVAGGADKAEAIAAMLRGGYATTFVTDEDAAAGLLAQ